jgi:hypothetical protein
MPRKVGWAVEGARRYRTRDSVCALHAIRGRIKLANGRSFDVTGMLRYADGAAAGAALDSAGRESVAAIDAEKASSPA